MSLYRLLRGHLAPYRGAMVALVVLQALQAAANLLLPAVNSHLIDDGILTGDQGRILVLGAVMLGVSILQVVFAVAAMWFGTGAAMGFGRDVRGDLFARVTELSARDVGAFGAPSLSTRLTNDVQQVQLLLVLAATMMLAAPLTMVIGIVLAVREDAGLSWLLVVALPVEVAILGPIVARMMPAFQHMQERIDRINTVLREQITGVRVVRAFTREPEESARFGVDRCRPRRLGRDATGLARGLPDLPRPDPVRRPGGDVRAVDDPPRRGRRPAHHRGPPCPPLGAGATATRHSDAAAGDGRAPPRRLPLPGRRATGSPRRRAPRRAG